MSSSTSNQAGNAQKKQVPMFLVAIVITLGVIAVLLGLKIFTDTRTHNENIQFIEGEKNKLESELSNLIVDYDSLITQSDSLANQLTAEQDKIKQLLRREASNATKIRMYTRELETLRKVMRSYIVQIDSLNTRNQELTDENLQVRGELKQVSSDLETVSKQKDELSTKVALAQKLNAKNVVAVGLKKGSKESAKIKKLEKIRVCFTVRENRIANPGSKMVYLSLIRPDDVTLSSAEAGMFEYDGQSLVYSAKRELEYENSDIDMCIYWDVTEELIPGTYFLSLYCEGHEIGTGSFTLD